jgi:hypothetical protein
MSNYVVPGDGANYGVDINTGGIADSFANFVWEPAVVKVIVLSFWSLSIYLSSYCYVDMSLVTMFFLFRSMRLMPLPKLPALF